MVIAEVSRSFRASRAERLENYPRERSEILPRIWGTEHFHPDGKRVCTIRPKWIVGVIHLRTRLPQKAAVLWRV